MVEQVPVAAMSQIPWFNPQAVDGRIINLMPYWDGQKWYFYHFHEGRALPLQIVDVSAADYLAKAPQRPTDIRIPFAEIMWQRASFPETLPFILGILADFSNFSASVSKLRFLHSKRNDIPDLAVTNYARTEIEYLLSLSRGVFDLLQELFSILWRERVQLLDPEKEKIRKRSRMPKSFADVALQGDDIRSSDEICRKWALPETMAIEYTRVAPFFLHLRDWRNRIIHGGTNFGPIFVDDDGFKIRVADKLFSWANCWSMDDITETGLGSLEPWLAQVIFGSMAICSTLAYTFAQVIRLPEPIAPDLMVFSRNPTDDALYELKTIYDKALAQEPRDVIV
jgi:hypothetical protein